MRGQSPREIDPPTPTIRGERTVAARVEASGAREGDEKIARDVVGGGVEGAEGGF